MRKTLSEIAKEKSDKKLEDYIKAHSGERVPFHCWLFKFWVKEDLYEMALSAAISIAATLLACWLFKL